MNTVTGLQPGVATTGSPSLANAYIGQSDMPAWNFNPFAMTANRQVAQTKLPFGDVAGVNGRQDPVDIHDFLNRYYSFIQDTPMIKQLEDNIDAMVFMQNNWVQIFMPLDFMTFTDSTNLISRTTVEYLPAMPTYVPELTNGKLLPKRSYTAVAGIERYGFAMMFIPNFMKTVTGIRDYVLQQLQLVGSLVQFLMYQGINSMVRSHENELMVQARRKQLGAPSIENLMAFQAESWDCIRRPKGLTKLHTKVHLQMQENRGKVPMHIILPPRAIAHIKDDRDYTDYYIAGPSGPELLRSTVVFGSPYMSNTPFQAYKGAFPEGDRDMSVVPVAKLLGNTGDVYVSSVFRTGDNFSLDPMSTQREKGWYNLMEDTQQMDTPANSPYSSYQRTIGVQDLDRRGVSRITLAQAWENLKNDRFDENGLPRTLPDKLAADYPPNFPSLRADVHNYEGSDTRTTLMYGDFRPEYFSDQSLDRLGSKAAASFLRSSTVKNAADVFRFGVDLLRRIDNVQWVPKGKEIAERIYAAGKGKTSKSSGVGAIPFELFGTTPVPLVSDKLEDIPIGYASRAGIKALANLASGAKVGESPIKDDIMIAKNFDTLLDDMAAFVKRAFPHTFAADENMATEIWANPDPATTLVELLVGIRTPLLIYDDTTLTVVSTRKRITDPIEATSAVFGPIFDRLKAYVIATLFDKTTSISEFNAAASALEGSAYGAEVDITSYAKLVGGILGTRAAFAKTTDPKKTTIPSDKFEQFKKIVANLVKLFKLTPVTEVPDVLDLSKCIQTFKSMMKVIAISVASFNGATLEAVLDFLENHIPKIDFPSISTVHGTMKTFIETAMGSDKVKSFYGAGSLALVIKAGDQITGSVESAKKLWEVADGKTIVMKGVSGTDKYIDWSKYKPTTLVASRTLVRGIVEEFKKTGEPPRLWPADPLFPMVPLPIDDLESVLTKDPVFNSPIDTSSAFNAVNWTGTIGFVGQAARIATAYSMEGLGLGSGIGAPADLGQASYTERGLQYSDLAEYISAFKRPLGAADTFYRQALSGVQARQPGEAQKRVLQAAAMVSNNFRARFEYLSSKSAVGVLEKFMAKVFLLTPVTWAAGKAFIDNDITLPYSIVVARPHAKFTTGTVIFSEKNIGNTFMARGALTMGDDSRIQYHFASFTFESGTMISKPMAMYVAQDAIVTKYHRGMGIKPIKAGDDYKPQASMYGGDAYFLLLPYNTQLHEKHELIMTGITHNLPDDKTYMLSTQERKPNYETAGFTNAVYDLYPKLSAGELAPQEQDGGMVAPAVNLVCAEGPTVLFGNDGLPSGVKPGAYLWGNMIGSRAVSFQRGEEGTYPTEIGDLRTLGVF